MCKFSNAKTWIYFPILVANNTSRNFYKKSTLSSKKNLPLKNNIPSMNWEEESCILDAASK